ncbi:hypothetical protein [Cellulomonas sp. URHD0024]|uniref:hypothetical protein n=1 Tax=Cellulomonas sp. URHD0024 TaxID=1302620 RepID=UPI00040CA93C|nr:hypothetical protein [Cellulomonas sp. URHD0024]
MPVDSLEVVVGLATDVRVNLRTGDLTASTGTSQDRLLLAGLGPLRWAARYDEDVVFLETVEGERWLVRVSPISGLVAAVEPAVGVRPPLQGDGLCVTRT